jgi:Tfp pilus assembly PilM family ATPase
MASKINVLDLGSYSVKVITLSRSLVGTSVVSMDEHVLGSRADGKGRDRETWKLLKESFEGKKRLAGDTITLGYPGERILNRKLDMPFNDRAKIDKILPFELEQHVPYSAENIVADYLIRRIPGKKNGSEIFAGIIQESQLVELMSTLDTSGLEPRVLTHPLISMGRLPLPQGGPGELNLIVDIGHTKTLAVIMQGNWIVANRCIMRGGMALTKHLAEELQVSFEDAEQLKHEAHLFPAGQEELGEGRPHVIAQCMRDSLAGIARDLLAMIRSIGPDTDVTLHLMGGTANLSGIVDFFSGKLNVQVDLIDPVAMKVACPSELNGAVVSPALAIGLDAAKGADSSKINLRRLKFPYEGDFKYLRGRFIYLGLMALALALTFLTPSVLKYRSLQDNNDAILEEIGVLSEGILGEAIEDPEEVADALADIPKPDVWTVFPDITALETFFEVEDVVASIDGLPMEGVFKDVPTKPELRPEASPDDQPGDGEAEVPPEPPQPELESHELFMSFISIDMQGRTRGQNGVVEFRGDSKSVATLEFFETEVGRHPCFNNVIRSSQEVITSNNERKGWQRFTITFNVSCPKKDERLSSRKGKGPEGDEDKVKGGERADSSQDSPQKPNDEAKPSSNDKTRKLENAKDLEAEPEENKEEVPGPGAKAEEKAKRAKPTVNLLRRDGAPGDEGRPVNRNMPPIKKAR